jgi:autotransporter-associated beta strand protein/T5SS/PEP-CTERM-associated repeat protein
MAGLLVLAPLAVRAQDSTWVGSTGAWTTASNWAPFAPIAGAIIDNSGTATFGAGENGGALSVKLGSTGAGSALVNGGLFHSVLTYLGDQTGSNGKLTVTSGAVTLSPGYSFGGVVVGNSGTGSLLINGPNAYVGTYSVVMANSAGSHGTATVTSGSMFSVMLGVGGGGNGNLLINGGSVLSGTSFIGFGEGQGNVTMSSGSWQTYHTTVGQSGTGHLQIDGGDVYSPLLRIASGTAVGSVALNGGSLSTNEVTRGTGTASFHFGGGTLTASADSGNFFNGFSSSELTSTGTAFINSNGFTITSTVGLGGSGVLTKLGAGTLNFTDTNAYTGGTIVRSGTLAVNGGVINHAARSVLVGNTFGDNGSVSILNGGRISSLNTFLGNVAGSTGKATVTSGTWTTANTFYVGQIGNGELLVNGGVVTNTYGFIGFNPGASGTATISSGTWANSNYLAVGDLGSGHLVVSGGAVTNSLGYIGLSFGGTGVAAVSGGVWANTNTLTIGDSGHGVLSITDSGLVTSGTVLLGDKSGSQGRLNIGTGGVAGTLQTAVVRGGAGSAQVSFNHTGSLTFGARMEGSVVVEKVGSGTLTLSGSNSYTGGTNLVAGTLILTDVGSTASVLGSGTVTIQDGATLSGAGTVLGDTILKGTLTPGNSPDEIYFGAGLLMENTAIVGVELASLASFDRIAVAGLLTYDGTLSITLIGGYLPEVGDTFALFDADTVALGSNFDAIIFDNPDYLGSFDTATGVLTITAVPEPSTAVLLLAGGVFLARRRGRVVR